MGPFLTANGVDLAQFDGKKAKGAAMATEVLRVQAEHRSQQALGQEGTKSGPSTNLVQPKSHDAPDQPSQIPNGSRKRAREETDSDFKDATSAPKKVKTGKANSAMRIEQSKSQGTDNPVMLPSPAQTVPTSATPSISRRVITLRRTSPLLSPSPNDPRCVSKTRKLLLMIRTQAEHDVAAENEESDDDSDDESGDDSDDDVCMSDSDEEDAGEGNKTTLSLLTNVHGQPVLSCDAQFLIHRIVQLSNSMRACGSEPADRDNREKQEELRKEHTQARQELKYELEEKVNWDDELDAEQQARSLVCQVFPY